MGAAESRPPPGYVLQEYSIGQQVKYRSQHGFEVDATIVSKHFDHAYGCHVYGVIQRAGTRVRRALPWELKPVGPYYPQKPGARPAAHAAVGPYHPSHAAPGPYAAQGQAPGPYGAQPAPYAAAPPRPQAPPPSSGYAPPPGPGYAPPPPASYPAPAAGYPPQPQQGSSSYNADSDLPPSYAEAVQSASKPK